MSSVESQVELWIYPVENYPMLKHTSIQAFGEVFSYSENGLQANPVVIIFWFVIF